MHVNHRRKRPAGTTKRTGCRGWMRIYSMRDMKRQKSRDRRARERSLLERGRWDDLPDRYPRNIVWEYW